MKGLTLPGAGWRRAEGFAEADPSHDLDGWDAAVKVAALAVDADWRPAVENRGEGIFIG